ncbi:hypothetical protein ACLB9X_23420 [Streptomyces sp. 5K101]|uniref:hypothetical protein n=1 Tax=Streptomyces sp. 5K101 TaxID=3390037 RepID=UPI0039750839
MLAIRRVVSDRPGRLPSRSRRNAARACFGASHPGVVGVAQVDGRLRAARDDVGQVRVDDQVADGGAQVAVLAGVDQLPQVDDDLCRGESGIGAQVGGRGAGVRGAAWMVISCRRCPGHR